MKSTLRCFIAVEIAPQVRSEVERIRPALARIAPDVKLVRPDQFHLTLKFLGDVPTVDIYTIQRAVEAACAEVEPFDLFFERLGAFPDENRPHTLWVGLSEGTEEIRDLAERIENRLLPLGFPREKRLFMPHLTIGRVRRQEEGNFSELASFLADRQETCFGASEVDAVTIFSSQLSRSGPKYEVLAEIDLKR